MAGAISRLHETSPSTAEGGCSDDSDKGTMVNVRSVAGERLLQVSTEDCQTAGELKERLQSGLALPLLRLRLVSKGCADLLEEVRLNTLPMPRELTAVVLNYEQQHTAELLNAAEDGDAGLVKRLLEKLADPNGSEGEGWTPLHITALNGHIEVAKQLLFARADLSRTNADGGGPLHVAAWSGHLELMNALYHANADPERAQNEGWTPLHIASRNGHAQIVRWLLFELGVNAHQRVDAGWTAAGIAWWADHPSVSTVFESYSAKEHPLVRIWQNLTDLIPPLLQWVWRPCARRAK